MLSRATAASASGRVNAPAYSALPTIAPSTPSGASAGDRAQVGQAGHAAAGDHGPVGARAHAAQQVQVGPGQHAVLVDVGDHIPARSRPPPAGRAPRRARRRRVVQPRAASRVPRTSSPTATRSPCSAMTPADPVGVLQRRGADARPGRSRWPARQSSAASSRMPPDSSTCTSSRPISSASSAAVRAPAERGVQVDQVNPLRARVLPGQRRVDRVAVAGLGPGRALHQPDRLAAGHVHGGQQVKPGLRTSPSVVQASHRGVQPVGQQRGAGVGRTSPGGTGSPSAGRPPPARRSPRHAWSSRPAGCSARQAGAGLRRGVGVHEVEQRVRVDAREQA